MQELCKYSLNKGKRILSFFFIFLLLLSTTINAKEYTQDYNNPLTRSITDSIYCLRYGECNLGDLFVWGNFTVVGELFNATMTVVNYVVTGEFDVQGDMNIGGDLDVSGNITANNFIGNLEGNFTGNWSGADDYYTKSEVYPIDSLYNQTYIDTLGNWSKDRPNYINITSLDNTTIIRVGNESWINQSGLIQNWSNIISSGEVDGGFANSVYLPIQLIDGGSA